MKPTKRDKTYLQSFGKAFKPVRKYNQMAFITAIGAIHAQVAQINAIKNSIGHKHIPENGGDIVKVNIPTGSIVKPKEWIMSDIAPIDCGIDMVTVNQQIRDAIKNRLIIITDESKKEFTNLESMKNPERVEC